ncbi:DUF305 domain-containing protein [Streptomyces sp. WAC 06738]|uniref:DUF305 domain-containing protein n=1 Tax=Streptomyces sp. WAC 06738 TaxID=2203210 RepID=UPI000F715C2B|nr:DUF305 domain-containing protein [Streptomyces sp. WAC 06738]AZM44765.1 DUF305 domain-containing protein [Streptomyces sp. WAC 06738]
MRHPRALASVVPLTAALLLAGCTGGGSSDDAGDGGKASVIAPGKPGEEASKIPADQVEEARGDDRPNAADTTYMRDMIEHHGQAIVMTGLAEKRAGAEGVRGIAERIAAGQQPEIAVMEAWLEENPGGGGEEGHDGGHAGGHEGMPGMASEADLDRLRAARGEEFDALFLKLMIAHHEGAVEMAEEVLGKGNNEYVEQLATGVIAQQLSEIGRMEKLA